MTEVPSLSSVFLERPIAHRGLHNIRDGRPENSRTAFEAAIAAGYGIELDLQLSRDGRAMVFHDYSLTRLTGLSGAIQQRNAAELSASPLLHGASQTIPTFAEVLRLVAGRVPLLVELKDQDGAMGPNIGALEDDVAKCAARYEGPIAFMSFNPNSVVAMAERLPQFARGLTTCPMTDTDSLMVPAEQRAHLARIADFTRSNSCFISHDHRYLDNPRVAELKAQGVPILCWTTKTPAEQERALTIADNVTFEQYTPA
jgi:glycerophosphoryl diester phosphodiesterase